MTTQKLEIAFWDYDRARALAEGSVKISGVEARFHTAPIVTQIFEAATARMLQQSDGPSGAFVPAEALTGRTSTLAAQSTPDNT